MVIAELTQTCDRYPSQWEGRLDDGRPIYIRFRHDELSVHIGPMGGDVGSAADAAAWLELRIPGGGGEIHLSEVLSRTGLRMA
jgi:hypothetical protein